MADDKQLEVLSATVNTLSESVAQIAQGLKTLTDAQAQLVANQQAKDEAELADLRVKIVKANLLDGAAAGELTLNAARALAKAAGPGKAAPLFAGLAGNAAGDTTGSFKLPKAGA